ncbi:MAG: hypothetical protein QXF45_03595 [Candidatus Caldarchaeum sp.]
MKPFTKFSDSEIYRPMKHGLYETTHVFQTPSAFLGVIDWDGPDYSTVFEILEPPRDTALYWLLAWDRKSSREDEWLDPSVETREWRQTVFQFVNKGEERLHAKIYGTYSPVVDASDSSIWSLVSAIQVEPKGFEEFRAEGFQLFVWPSRRKEKRFTRFTSSTKADAFSRFSLNLSITTAQLSIGMGRTAPTYRQMLEAEVQSWAEFRKALLKNERESFDRLVSQSFRYVHAGTMNPLRKPFENFVMSVLLSHEERLWMLEENLRKTMQIDGPGRLASLQDFFSTL